MTLCDDSDSDWCCYKCRTPRLARSHQNLPLGLLKGAQPHHLTGFLHSQATCKFASLQITQHAALCCRPKEMSPFTVTGGSYDTPLKGPRCFGFKDWKVLQWDISSVWGVAWGMDVPAHHLRRKHTVGRARQEALRRDHVLFSFTSFEGLHYQESALLVSETHVICLAAAFRNCRKSFFCNALGILCR